MISSIQNIYEHFVRMDHQQVLPPSPIEILQQSIFSAQAENPNQRSSSVWIDRSKEYGTSLDPWSHVHSTDEGIIQLMMIGEAPWEDYHHCSHLLYYNEDYSSDLDHPLIFDFLSNTVNTMDSERNLSKLKKLSPQISRPNLMLQRIFMLANLVLLQNWKYIVLSFKNSEMSLHGHMKKFQALTRA